MGRARNTSAVDTIATVYFSQDQMFSCCLDLKQLFLLKQTHSDFWVQMSWFKLHEAAAGTPLWHWFKKKIPGKSHTSLLCTPPKNSAITATTKSLWTSQLVELLVLCAAQNYTLHLQRATFGLWLSIHHFYVRNSDQEFANCAPTNWNLCCWGQWKPETETPLIVENDIWASIMRSSWTQLPGSSDSKIQVFSFSFSLIQDKHKDEASFILVAFTPLWQHSLEPNADIYGCPTQTFLNAQGQQHGVKLHYTNKQSGWKAATQRGTQGCWSVADWT